MIESIIEIGETNETVPSFLQASDTEFAVFRVIKVVRMVRSSLRVQSRSKTAGDNSPLGLRGNSSTKDVENWGDEGFHKETPFEDSPDNEQSSQNPHSSHSTDRQTPTRLKMYSSENFGNTQELNIPTPEQSETNQNDDESINSYDGSASLKPDGNKSDSCHGGVLPASTTPLLRSGDYSPLSATLPKRKNANIPRGSRTSIHEEKEKYQEQATSPDSNPKSHKHSNSLNSDEDTVQRDVPDRGLCSQESMEEAVIESQTKAKRRASENTSTVHSQLLQLRQLRTPFDIIESELEESSVSVSHRDKSLLVETLHEHDTVSEKNERRDDCGV